MTAEQEIYFRASSFGNLMTSDPETSISDKQLQQIKDFEDRVLESIDNPKKALTQPMKDELERLKAKRDAPPQLSKTTKSEIEKMWLLNEKGYYDELDNKYVIKGLLNEQDGLGLVSKVLGLFLKKNEKRIYKDNVTGEADAFTTIDGKKIVVDVKCSWNPATFMKNTLSKIYEFQLRIYMYLYDVDEAYLCYCLTDTPEHMVEDEKHRQWKKYFVPSMSVEEQEALEQALIPVYEQIDRNMVFSIGGRYTTEERVKTFKITRNLEIEKEMLSKIKPAIEYYKSIKLNQTT